MGELFREGTSRLARSEELALYEEVQDQQAKQDVPLLQRADNAHQYMYFALFDGTGQDVRHDKHITNVGILKRQLDAVTGDPASRIGTNYIEGIGTQYNPALRVLDGALAYTWDEKIERAYSQLATQAQKWKALDPDAQIHIVEVGYSRGAVLIPGFAQLVDRYGITDPDGLSFGRDRHGNITVESRRPPLVPPGQTAQAVALYDPVATSMPRNYDARLPPSVISGFSLLAANERREAFPHQTIADQGLAADGRFLGTKVPGGHSNVGGGNRDPGLESMAFNMVADYLNALRDQPLIQYRELPADLASYTVYQARGVTAVPGLDRDGQRNLRDELTNCLIVDPCRDAEAMDQTLASRFEYRRLQPNAPTLALSASEPPLPGQHASDKSSAQPWSPDDPAHPDHGLLEQIRSGVRSLDQHTTRKAFDEESERLSRSLLAASKGSAENGSAEREPDQSISRNVLSRADHVVLGADGRFAFVVEGSLRDPAHRYARVDIAEAIRTPVEQSDLRLDAANRQIERELQTEQELQPRQSRESDRLSRVVPAMP